MSDSLLKPRPKELYNSPSGARLIGGAQAVCMNATRLAGRYAAWGRLYSTLKRALAYARHKEDPWNSILASAATCGLVSMRQGFGPMALAAMRCGALSAFSHRNSFESAQREIRPITLEVPPQMRDKAAAPSWCTYSRVFGQKIKDRPTNF